MFNRTVVTSNTDHPAVIAGYKIMETVINSISESVSGTDIKVVFTIIPTKELVYAKKVSTAGLQAPADYQMLVEREKSNIETLAKQIHSIPHVKYVDVLNPLQQQALRPVELYRKDQNGHPVAAGYAVIGREIAKVVKPLLSVTENILQDTSRDLVTLEVSPGHFLYLLLKNNSVYYFDSLDLIEKNGWPPGEVKTVTLDEIANFAVQGTITEIDPSLFGPLKSNTSKKR